MSRSMYCCMQLPPLDNKNNTTTQRDLSTNWYGSAECAVITKGPALTGTGYKEVGVSHNMNGSVLLSHLASHPLATIQSIAWDDKFLQGKLLGLLHGFFDGSMVIFVMKTWG